MDAVVIGYEYAHCSILFPSPLWGGVRGGGREVTHRRRRERFPLTTPHLRPPPPWGGGLGGGGREVTHRRRRERFPLTTPHLTLPHKGGGSNLLIDHGL